MAVRKDEAQNIADQAAQEAIEASRMGAQQAERTGEKAREATQKPAEEAARGIVHLGREQGERAAEATREGARQTGRAADAASAALASFADQSRGNMEAAVASSTRIARGLQEMGWEVARFSQDSLRGSLRAATDIMQCRSLEDMVEVQSRFVSENMDRVMDEQLRLLRLSRAAADEAEQTLRDRIRHQQKQVQPQGSGPQGSGPQA